MTSQLEAEQTIVGSVIEDARPFLDVHERGIRPEHFTDPVLRTAYEQVSEARAKGEEILFNDLLERVSRLSGQPVFPLVEAQDRAASIGLVWKAAHVLKESHARRELVSVADRIRRAVDRGLPSEKIRARAMQYLVGREEAHREATEEDGQASYKAAIEALERRKAGDVSGQGVRLGWSWLDSHVRGFRPGRVTIISGYSGHGKTAIALNWFVEICVRQRVPGVYFSLEMTPAELRDRMLGILSGNSIESIEAGKSTPALSQALHELKTGKQIIVGGQDQDVDELVLSMGGYVRRFGIKVAFVDYITLLKPDRPGEKEGRDQPYTRWVNKIVRAARRLRVHAFVLAQSNSDGELSESKGMIRDVDHLLRFFRQGASHYLETRKNRHGPGGYIYAIDFDRATQRMRENGVIARDELNRLKGESR